MPTGGTTECTGEACVTHAVGNVRVSVSVVLLRYKDQVIKRERSVNSVASGLRTAYN